MSSSNPSPVAKVPRPPATISPTLVLTVWLLTGLTGWGGSAAVALDCPAVHILPHLAGGKVLLEGYVTTGKLRPGTRRRDRIRGLFARPAASASIVLRVAGTEYPQVLDEHGAFACLTPTWTGTATVSVEDPQEALVLFRKDLCLPPPPKFLMVSDIDDTIQVTEVTRRVRMVINSLLKKVENRLPVPGTPDPYRFLAAGGHFRGVPLVVYLSCSPAALARSLESFLDRNGFPAGVLVVKQALGADGNDPRVHKSKWLKRLVELYPGLPLLCLGDSGEKDPEIYAEFAASGPAKVLGIVIRQVPGREKRDRKRLEDLAATLKSKGPPLFVWSNPDELRAALVSLGFPLPSVSTGEK